MLCGVFTWSTSQQYYIFLRHIFYKCLPFCLYQLCLSVCVCVHTVCYVMFVYSVGHHRKLERSRLQSAWITR